MPPPDHRLRAHLMQGQKPIRQMITNLKFCNMDEQSKNALGAAYGIAKKMGESLADLINDAINSCFDEEE